MNYPRVPDAFTIEKDAFALRQPTMPDDHVSDIIIPHVNTVVRSAMDLPHFSQEIGQVNPRVQYVADYVNGMFRRHYRHRDVIVPSQADTIFNDYLRDEYSVNLAKNRFNIVDRAVGLTAMSCMWFATSRIRGEQTRLSDFTCRPIVTSQEQAA